MASVSQKIKDEIKIVESQCRQAKKLLNVKSLIKWAREHPGSATYKKIFKDDKDSAANNWYEHVARRLITFYIEDRTEPPRLVRAFISVPTDRVTSAGYRPYQEVLRKVNLKKSCREEMFNKLQGQRVSSSWDRELDAFFDALDELCDSWREQLELEPMLRQEEALA